MHPHCASSAAASLTLATLITFVSGCSSGGSTEPDTENEPAAKFAEAFPCGQVTGLSEFHCEVLLILYGFTNGDGWTDKTGWLDSRTPCTWFGITCSDGQVVQISLPSNRLTGTIPFHLAGLTLNILDLSDNGLTGEIPSDFGHLLQTLNLSRNQLTGTIPPELGNIPNLRVLNLRDNLLAGTIPPELEKLSQLAVLQIAENQLTDPIPPELGDMILARLFLGGNQLMGMIPPELGNLSSLQWLSLRENQLEGLVPFLVADLGGQLQSAALNRCDFESNPALSMPGTQEYLDANFDDDGFICGIPLSTLTSQKEALHGWPSVPSSSPSSTPANRRIDSMS